MNDDINLLRETIEKLSFENEVLKLENQFMKENIKRFKVNNQTQKKNGKFYKFKNFIKKAINGRKAVK